MKNVLKKLSVVMFVVIAVVVVSCAPPTTTPVASSTVTIYVATFGAATNRVDSITGNTNVLYIVGDLAGMTRADDGQAIASWDPTSAVAQMEAVSPNLHKIVLNNNLTANATTDFKFVNGTATFGGTWGNQEQRLTNTTTNDVNTTIFEDGGNRGFDVVAGQDLVIWLTNEVVPTAMTLGTESYGIASWKGTGPTYSVNCAVSLIITNANLAPGEMINVTASNYVSVGTNMQLWGSYNSWGGAVTNADVDASSNLTVVVTQTSASADFQFRATSSVSGVWAYDVSGANFTVIIPAGVTTTNVYLNGGSWRNW